MQGHKRLRSKGKVYMPYVYVIDFQEKQKVKEKKSRRVRHIPPYILQYSPGHKMYVIYAVIILH